MKRSIGQTIGHWILVISAAWLVAVGLAAWVTANGQTMGIFQALRLGLPVWHLIVPAYGILSLVLLLTCRPGTYWYVAIGHFIILFAVGLALNIAFESVSDRTGLKPTTWTTLIAVLGMISSPVAIFMALKEVVPINSPAARFAYLGRRGHLRELLHLAAQRGWQATGPQLPDHTVLVSGSWDGRDITIHSGESFLGNDSGHFYWVTVAAKSILPAMAVAIGRPLPKPDDRQRELRGKCLTAGKRMADFYLWPQAGQVLSQNAMNGVAQALDRGKRFLRTRSIVYTDYSTIYYGQQSPIRITDNADQMSELIGWLADLTGVLEHEAVAAPVSLPAHEMASAHPERSAAQSKDAPPTALGPSSLAGRALLAVLLTIGFYGLALIIAAALLFIVYADIRWTSRVHIQLIIGSILAAGAILWSIVPRIDRFEPPGPRLLPAEHPRLFSEVETIAKQMSQTMPREIYLVPDVNAGVMERGGVLGIGSKRVMIVGLSLLQALTVSQLRGVIAHEFGHFYGGDTKLGPWIYKTRGAIGRTIQNLENRSLLQAPFRWYGQMFLRTTYAISRRQEFVADGLAARLVGPQTYAEGLRTSHGIGPAFDSYMHQEYIPALENGYRPPFLEGFNRFINTARVSQIVERLVVEQAQSGQTDPFDTHPSLSERLAALAALPAAASTNDASPATSLLGDVAAAEAALLASMVRPEYRDKLQPVTWDDIGATAYLPNWQKTVRTHADGLSGHTVATLPDLLRTPAALADDIKRLAGRTLLQQEVAGAILGIAGTALAVALARQGWTVDATPGIPITLRRGDDAVETFGVPRMLAEGKLTGDAWLQRCKELDIADLDLADA